MNANWFLFLVIFYSVGVKAQHFNEYSYADKMALSIPPAETYTTSLIANYIKLNFKTDHEKFRGIYTWVTANLKYSTDSMYSINWGADAEAKITAALRRRKGVCENYAEIFNDIANKAGLTSFVVTGYTKQDGYVNRTGHVWCAVYLNNEWFFCDPTWDEGLTYNTRWFLVPPDQFIESHIAFDPLWQLLPYPLTQKEFNRGIGYAKKNTPAFNYSDSALAFLQLNELQQHQAAFRRIQQAGIENELQKNWHAFIKMKIAIVHGENDMELYNAAVEDLNRATNIFNAFVQYRNNNFTPAKNINDIHAMLDPIAGAILSAWQKINQIGKSAENFQYNTDGLSDRLRALTARVQEQKDFLKKAHLPPKM